MLSVFLLHCSNMSVFEVILSKNVSLMTPYLQPIPASFFIALGLIYCLIHPHLLSGKDLINSIMQRNTWQIQHSFLLWQMRRCRSPSSSLRRTWIRNYRQKGSIKCLKAFMGLRADSRERFEEEFLDPVKTDMTCFVDSGRREFSVSLIFLMMKTLRSHVGIVAITQITFIEVLLSYIILRITLGSWWTLLICTF